MYSKGSENVGDVGNVGNASEEVRSKVQAMTTEQLVLALTLALYSALYSITLPLL